jgi:hypothetical protein
MVTIVSLLMALASYVQLSGTQGTRLKLAAWFLLAGFALMATDATFATPSLTKTGYCWVLVDHLKINAWISLGF